jgi:hypothetical protein
MMLRCKRDLTAHEEETRLSGYTISNDTSFNYPEIWRVNMFPNHLKII